MAFKTLEAKDPDGENNNYKFDLSSYLQSGELIASVVSVTLSDPLLTETHAITDSSTSVTVYLTGGTENQWANVTVRFTTDRSPTPRDDRTFRIFIKQR